MKAVCNTASTDRTKYYLSIFCKMGGACGGGDVAGPCGELEGLMWGMGS